MPFFWLRVLTLAFVCSSMFAQSPNVRFGEVETTYVELGRFGFTPREVKRKPGKHFFVVRNTAALNFRISRDNGVAVKEVTVDAARRHWSELVDLPVGRFIITDLSNPTFQLIVTVQN